MECNLQEHANLLYDPLNNNNCEFCKGNISTNIWEIKKGMMELSFRIFVYKQNTTLLMAWVTNSNPYFFSNYI